MSVVGLSSVLFLVLLVGLVLQVIALVDAIRRSPEALEPSGGKTLWVALLAVSLLIPGGLVLGLVYLLVIRKRAAALS